MKKITTLIMSITLILALVFTSCTGTSETPAATDGSKPLETTDQPQNTGAPAATTETPVTSEPTPAPESTPEPGPSKVTLTNSPDSTGNTNHASSHYGLHIAYGQEMVTVMSYMTMFNHGGEITRIPDKVEGFELQAEDLQYYNGLLYFLLYDWDNGVYYLYSYDFDSEPVKVSDSTVYHYEFINGKIYFTKEFVQGPIFAMDPNGGSEIQISTMRAHSFVHDDQALYFYATDAGTAPGLIKYDLATNDETTVVFPFYSHNYLVHSGYVYYAIDSGTYRSIHRMSLSNQTVSDIWVEMTDWTISMNISDSVLYMLVGDSVYKSDLDGSGRTEILKAEDNLQSGLYIFGDRIYCADGAFVYCTLTDGSEVSMFAFNVLQ